MKYLSKDQVRKIRSLAEKLQKIERQREIDQEAVLMEIAIVAGLSKPTEAADILLGSSAMDWERKDFKDRMVADVELFFVKAAEEELEAVKERIRKLGIVC